MPLTHSSASFKPLKSRQQLVEIFSTFVQFETGRYGCWLSDRRLHRNMQRHLAASPDLTIADVWALYWHRVWTETRPAASPQLLPKLHLSAYLQESCYWVAQQTHRRFPSAQQDLADYFQIAIAQIERVLHHYNADRLSSLEGYAKVVFLSILKDSLRQHKEVALCSDWGLLRRVSKKLVRETLLHMGLPAAETAQYQRAWQCFKEVCVPVGAAGTMRLDDRHWQAIAQCYLAETSEIPAAKLPKLLETWLTRLAGWVRSYLYPPTTSLNQPQVGQEGGELLDDLSEPHSRSLLDDLIQREFEQQRQNWHGQLRAVLTQTLHQFDPETQTLLRLYYQERLPQQQIMQHLQMSQPTISRRLKKAKEALLTALLNWSETTLKQPIAPEAYRQWTTLLEEWLEVHCHQVLCESR